MSGTTTQPGFVASVATLNAPGDAVLGSAVRYPGMSIPMPYQQVQMQPVAQLIEPTLDRMRQAQQNLLTMPVIDSPEYKTVLFHPTDFWNDGVPPPGNVGQISRTCLGLDLQVLERVAGPNR